LLRQFSKLVVSATHPPLLQMWANEFWLSKCVCKFMNLFSITKNLHEFFIKAKLQIQPVQAISRHAGTMLRTKPLLMSVPWECKRIKVGLILTNGKEKLYL
ncbi:MAG: hypothetical protein NC338_01100, partial [Firmicutes bacterium]|nr:hypothetical protein [Bacillota bacterium]MCM1477132.1 hypothetical protein [Bacteroides sp.]